MKPKKLYSKIGHLIGSKTGEADRTLDEKETFFFTERKLSKNERIIITEKFDGSCVAICKENNKIVARVKAGYTADTSPYIQHHVFAGWVLGNKEFLHSILQDGDRLVCEWMYQVHGTKYTVNMMPHKVYGQPIIALDLFREGQRLSYDEFSHFCYEHDFTYPVELSVLSRKPEVALTSIEIGYRNINTDKPEGLVYRYEKDGKFMNMAKWVRPDFDQGKYMNDNILNNIK